MARLEKLAVELDVDAGQKTKENGNKEAITMKTQKMAGIRQSRVACFHFKEGEKEEEEEVNF